MSRHLIHGTLIFIGLLVLSGTIAWTGVYVVSNLPKNGRFARQSEYTLLDTKTGAIYLALVPGMSETKDFNDNTDAWSLVRKPLIGLHPSAFSVSKNELLTALNTVLAFRKQNPKNVNPINVYDRQAIATIRKFMEASPDDTRKTIEEFCRQHSDVDLSAFLFDRTKKK